MVNQPAPALKSSPTSPPLSLSHRSHQEPSGTVRRWVRHLPRQGAYASRQELLSSIPPGSHHPLWTRPSQAPSVLQVYSPRVLLDVLDLLADALEFTLELDHAVGDGRIVAFRANGIHFAVHFLHQKFDFAA